MEWLGEDMLQRQHRSLLLSPIHATIRRSCKAPPPLSWVACECGVRLEWRDPRSGLGSWWEQSGASDALYSGAYGRAVTSGASAQRQMSAFA